MCTFCSSVLVALPFYTRGALVLLLRALDMLVHVFFVLLCREQVAGVSAGQYVRLFEWDYSKFAVRQRLPALVALIQGGVGKIEEEHRNLSMVFSEKNQALQVRGTSALPSLPSPPPLAPSLPPLFHLLFLSFIGLSFSRLFLLPGLLFFSCV